MIFRGIERVAILVSDTDSTSATITGNDFIGHGDSDYLEYAIEVGREERRISTIT